MMRPLAHCLRAVLLFSLAAANQCLAQPETAERQSKTNAAAEPIIDKALAIADLVLTHHIDPPTRQAMVLEGAKSLFKTAKLSQPPGLSRRVSAVATPEQFRSFLCELWDEASRSQVSSDQLESALVNGILSAVSGEPWLIPAKELKVHEQFAGNRYVGIGILLGYSQEAGFVQIKNTFKRGPAAQAGMKPSDLIVKIDSVDTHEMRLEKVVDMLRGEEGSVVTVSVKTPDATEVRTFKITRSVVPRETVVGLEATSDDLGKVRVSSAAPIGYLKIKEIGGSTVQELRQFEPQLREQGLQALILDLRFSHGNLHHSVMLADALLDGGVIGQVRTSNGVRKYEAEPDCLFRDWPLAVLVSNRTSGEAEWLVAALQDRKRAVIVGEPTSGNGFTITSIPVPDGADAIMLATGLLERTDGRPLERPRLSQSRRQSAEEILDPKSREKMGGVYPDHFVRREEANPRAKPVRTLAEIQNQIVFVEKSQTQPSAPNNPPRTSESPIALPEWKREPAPNNSQRPSESPKDFQLEKAIEVLSVEALKAALETSK